MESSTASVNSMDVDNGMDTSGDESIDEETWREEEDFYVRHDFMNCHQKKKNKRNIYIRHHQHYRLEVIPHNPPPPLQPNVLLSKPKTNDNAKSAVFL